MGEEEETPRLEGPQALKLIECGDASDNYAFRLIEEHLEEVLGKVPKGAKVAVVSVVGAFRTGKSFLLTLMLRYLRYRTQFEEAAGGEAGAWLMIEGEKIGEGNENSGVDETGKSFGWRGGRTRMTTGISIWSEPFMLKPELAVLILDTQGLFDNETTMGLTSCIFGLSTLMSSYQMYNVANRIQEDNLQQLALFTEYGRMAVEASKTDTKKGAQEEAQDAQESEPPPPFQKLEFLVRDWTELEESMSDEAMEKQCAEYLDQVLGKRDADDLAFTREQIKTCFSDISCWLLPHPGFAVTKLHYDGSVDAIEPLFKRCVTTLMHHVFDPDNADANALAPKQIGGKTLTAPELANYVKAYAGMFADGARFPQATTMLEATASANNRNAKDKALDAYNAVMDRACGTHNEAGFLQDADLEAKLAEAYAAAMDVFDATANMGRRAAIAETKRDLLDDINKAKSHYKLMNDARNPFLNAHIYAAPLGVAAAAYVVRKFTDTVCPDEGSFIAQRCNAVEDFLKEVHTFFLFGTLAYIVIKFWGLTKHLKKVMLLAIETATKQA